MPYVKSGELISCTNSILEFMKCVAEPLGHVAGGTSKQLETLKGCLVTSSHQCRTVFIHFYQFLTKSQMHLVNNHSAIMLQRGSCTYLEKKEFIHVDDDTEDKTLPLSYNSLWTLPLSYHSLWAMKQNDSVCQCWACKDKDRWQLLSTCIAEQIVWCLWGHP